MTPTKLIRIFILATLFVTRPSMAQGWNTSLPVYGCGESDGLAYTDAERSIGGELAAYRQQCTKQGGVFGSSMRRGFCNPDSPGSLFCRVECLVIGYASCSPGAAYVVQESVQLAEVGGNQNQAFDPGEQVKMDVTIRNAGTTAINAASGSIAIEGAEQIVTIAPLPMIFGDIKPGESKTVSTMVKVLSTAGCGSRVDLKFVITGTNFLYRFSQPFAVGRLTEAPIVATQSGIALPLKPAGISYVIADVTDVDEDIYQVKLAYSATVRLPRNFRVWLTAPNGKNAWAYFVDESRTAVVFNRDLTDKLRDVKTKGKWYLSGDMSQIDNSATITGFKLTIVPRKFTCEKIGDL